MGNPNHELTSLAADAYIYGSPLVFGLSMMDRLTTTGLGALPARRFNRFAHARRETAGERGTAFASDRDTLPSVAQLDLSAGPLLLHVPDTGGAYYVLQFIDAWSNNFAYVGRRAVGSRESVWLIAPPGWAGAPPDGAEVITSPTMVATIVGRNVWDGPADLPRVADLQRRLTLRPAAGSDPGRAGGAGLPAPDPAVGGRLGFFERLRVWMAAFPPVAADLAHQCSYAPLGLLRTAGPSPYADPDPALADALERGFEAGREHVEAAGDVARGDPEEAAGPGVPPAGGTAPPGGWEMNLHLFDYNLDHFGPGTLDSARWRIPDRPAAHLTRAVAARAGLWGHHAYEAASAWTSTDVEGRRLTGQRSYTLRFETPPPVDGFWSVTLDEAPDRASPGGRGVPDHVGDRTPGLRYGPDGSLEISLRHDRPADPGERANWLPTPAGRFRPVLRMYEPVGRVLDGAYQPPPIEEAA